MEKQGASATLNKYAHLTFTLSNGLSLFRDFLRTLIQMGDEMEERNKQLAAKRAQPNADKKKAAQVSARNLFYLTLLD